MVVVAVVAEVYGSPQVARRYLSLKILLFPVRRIGASVGAFLD